MKVHRLLAGIAVGLSAILVVSACGGGPASGSAGSGSPRMSSSGAAAGESGALESMEPIIFRVSDSSSEKGSAASALSSMIKYIEEKTGGKVTFERYYNATLSPADQALSSVESGLADIAFTSISYDPEELKIANWFNAAPSAAGSNYPVDALAGSLAVNEFYTTNQVFLDEFAANGVQPIAMVSSPAFPALCNTEVTSKEGFQGLKIRTAGGAWQKEVQALGAENVFLPAEDQYEGLQRGVIDCGVTASSSILPASLQEVAKYFYPASFSPSGGSGYVMNKEKWDALPEEVRTIFNEGRSYFLANQAKAFLTADSTLVNGGQVEIIPLPDLDAFLQDLQAKARAELAANPPAAVADGAALLSEFESSIDSWRALLKDDFSVDGSTATAEGVRAKYAAAAALDWDAYAQLLLKQSTKQ